MTSSTNAQTLLTNASIVLPDRVIEDGWLLIEGERIAALGEGGTQAGAIASTLDLSGNLLLPGLIDLHCDSIEKLVEPRPNIHFDIHMALREADWRLAGCGITTEFHAVSLDDGEFGVRSTGFVRELYAAIRSEPDLLVRHRLHTRLELSSAAGSNVVMSMIEQGQTDLVSLMDHSPGQGQFVTEQAFRDYVARTTSKSDEEIDTLVNWKRSQVREIAARISVVAQLVQNAGLALATHDDDSRSRVEQWPDLGVRISEFPTTMEAAQCAHELGLVVCMGAPNVLRGKSGSGNLSAIEAIRAGVVDALCSDYYPAAMLWSLFRLVSLNVLTLPQATRLVTLNPARAIKQDYEVGSLSVGKLADIIVVEPTTYRVERVFVGGKERVKRT